MADDSALPIAPRARFAAYAAGLFSLSIVPVSTVVVPLWAISLGAPPYLIGIALGARAALPVLLSIHGGALMDRLGPRGIMAVSAGVAAVLILFYPAFPWIGVVIVLQLLMGLLQALAWMGAQTQMVSMARGDAARMGRFSFISTLGNIVGPPAAGLAWDVWGPWGAFAVLSLCAACACLFALQLPRAGAAAGDGAATAFRLGDFLPRPGDYAAAFRMALAPMVGFIVACSFLMTSIFGVRHSFYTVYLESIGLSGTLIGVLLATGSLTASLAGLGLGPATRRVSATWLMLAAVTGAAMFIAATPLRHDFAGLLALAAAWGLSVGLAFPLTLHLLAKTVGSDRQGMAVGLRTTINRLAGFTVPIVMGAIAEATDLFTSFVVVGAAILACLAVLALLLARAPALGGRA